MITPDLLSKAMNYAEYKSLLENLLAQDKTTGSNQSAEFVQYAKINLQRMQRLEKTTVLNEAVKAALSTITSSYYLLVITEGWCGDAAQNLPVFHTLEKECKNITLKLILRDEHPDVIAQFLTNGGKSIPKIICLDKKDLKECFVWGPRPASLQEIVLALKKENKTHEEIGLATQNWYNADKTKSVQSEILHLVTKL